jgi:hypothetical protein
MKSLLPIALGVYFATIVLSRFHQLPLRWNRALIWLPCLALVACLAACLIQLDAEAPKFLLVLAAFAAALILSAWGIEDNGSERAQRGIEFIGLQTIALTIPVISSRVEAYALGWLVSSWLWLFWDRSRRKKSETQNRIAAAWNTLSILIGDVLFFTGLSLFYVSGDSASGSWNFPALLTPNISAAARLLWAACIWRLALGSLTALFEDDRITSDEKDLPFTFMMVIGFAFPGVHLLLDANTGVGVELFAPLHTLYSSGIQSLAIVCALVSLLAVFTSRRTRTSLAALCLNAWLIWAGSLTFLQPDWMLVCAFQTCLGLSLAWAFCARIESTPSPAPWMRGVAIVFTSFIVSSWTLLVPSSTWLFHFSHLSRADFTTPARSAFYASAVALSLLAGRLVAGAILWGESAREFNFKAFFFEAALLVSALFFVSMDFTIVASIGLNGVKWSDAVLLCGPLLIPFILGVGSAKWVSPPILAMGNPLRKFSIPTIRTSNTALKLAERFVWYFPAVMLHSTSRALASANASSLWFAFMLAGAALLFQRVIA